CADKHRLPHPRRGFCDRACPELAEGMGNLTFIFLLRRVPHPKSRSLRFRACPELVEGVGILPFPLSSIPQSSTPHNQGTTPLRPPSPNAGLISKTPPKIAQKQNAPSDIPSEEASLAIHSYEIMIPNSRNE